jgi:S-DNA-T family DNA segregation ATPase FtsK/SpoIIIE
VAPAEPAKPAVRRKAAGSGSYEPPSLGLFANPSENEIGMDESAVRKEAELLQEKLLSFGVKAEVTGWKTGPVITRFEIKPAPGVKVNQIVNLADDLALAMRAKRIRIVAPIPGKAAVGVEIPNPQSRVVRLREILESNKFTSGSHIIPLALGHTISGEPFVADLAGMPHLLLAGTTGSGKSVCINGIIASLLYRMGPEECRFIMVDPKMLELGIYNSIPHLITPVVTDPKKAVDALRWAVYEMEDRYDTLAAAMVRDLEQYNNKVHQLAEKAGKKVGAGLEGEEEEEIPEPLPYIIIIVDELADVMMTAMADIETLIQRLAQKARAVGIHLILATQRPSVDVITGPIKTNFSSRIAFQVPSKTDSRTILDLNGAEKLLGRGDMLFMNPSFPEPLRIHGSFLSNDEIERLVNLVSGQELQTEEMDIFAPSAGEVGGMGAAGEALDSMLRDAASVVVTHDQGSISLIQRRLGVGYTRAARMMDQLEMLGVVGPPDGTKAREVLMEEKDLDDLNWSGR